MTKEIKFRCWSKKANKMIHFQEPVYCDEYGELTFGIVEFPSISNLPSEYGDFKDWQLMQFTGLKDKNGKEIYEGDIVHYLETIPSENEKQLEIQGAEYVQLEFNGVVEWDKEGLSFDIVNEDNIRGFGARGTMEMEVIGNIYENPELLKSS